MSKYSEKEIKVTPKTVGKIQKPITDEIDPACCIQCGKTDTILKESKSGQPFLDCRHCGFKDYQLG